MQAATRLTALRRPRLPWPLPALLAWAAGWSTFILLGHAEVPPLWAWLAACALPALLALPIKGAWRRGLAALGFPLSTLVLGAASLPAWAWLLPLVFLLALYPVQAWRDAPLFPTALHALDGLAAQIKLPAAPRMLDAGCGLGHGLQALHRAWPQARLSGLERSAVIALAAHLRCRWAGLKVQVQSADMWAAPWGGQDLVYLFQRPESMARAWHKAQQEMAAGAWLVSLEFAVPGVAPHTTLQGAGQRKVWVYRVGKRHQGEIAAQPGAACADIPHRAARLRAANS